MASLSYRYGEKLESRETPHREAAQRNKTRERERGRKREKEGERERWDAIPRLDPAAIICSSRTEPRRGEKRVDHSQLTLPLATAAKLYPSRTFCMPFAWAPRVY